MVGFDVLPPKQGLYNPENETENCGVGFVGDLTKTPTRKTVTDALTVLSHMEHRGGCGCEPDTGDGAGIMVGIPHDFFVNECATLFPDIAIVAGLYAVGNVFFRRDEDDVMKMCKGVIESEVKASGLHVLGWRKVPTDNSSLGKTAVDYEPIVEQIIVMNNPTLSREQFELAMFALRKRASRRALENASITGQEILPMYICSLSSRTIVYKGMLTPDQVPMYYLDLQHEDFKSHVALVHSRFSTNTFPAWSRAQPYRFAAHNGEINTLRGNVNWMYAREGVMSSDIIGEQLSDCCPVVERGNTDSQTLDNVLELLHRGGRSLAHSTMMMVPEAWQNNDLIDEDRKAFYKYHASLMEPWDGPALVLFTDGEVIGATLDRNGLRPCRYYITKDKRLICASEVGVIPDIDPANIEFKGRLMPGRMLLADFNQGKVLDDNELKDKLAKEHPYGEWLEKNAFTLSHLAGSAAASKSEDFVVDPTDLPDRTKWYDENMKRLRAFGYTVEQLDLLLRPMAEDAYEALGSMGNDAPLACLSSQPRLMFDYFKQLFAQVTNPPIDPIRESVVMSVACFIGPERNLLKCTEEHVSRLYLENPVLSLDEMSLIKNMDYKEYKSKTIDMTYPRAEGPGGLLPALKRMSRETSRAIKDGYSFVVLSDRGANEERVPVSSLLSIGAVHHHLVETKERMKLGLIIESGEAREIHHMCLLVGFGADAVCPYMAYGAMNKMNADDKFKKTLSNRELEENYKVACKNGMLKVFAKMGISTLQSYKGAQIFEALGVGNEVVNFCFQGTASRIGGVSFTKIANDYLKIHAMGFPPRNYAEDSLTGLWNLGDYHWRAGLKSEIHINEPTAIAKVQSAVRLESKEDFRAFTKIHNDVISKSTLRGQLKIKESEKTVSIDEVESAAAIVKRFRTGAMSYGSISAEAHESLAIAMNRIGAKSNSGEGGEDEERWTADSKGDLKRSSIKQVASGRFGVTIHYLSNADEIQIKMAQGAKPGEGGELPGWKVSEDIAKTRHSTPGVGLISPPPHHDIYSIEDLAQLIHDLKNANPSANVSVKLVSKVGVGVIASGVAKGKADHILVSGYDGGTGASRWTGIKHAGLPWELGIAETHQTLVMNGLRGRVSLETDGNIRSGLDVCKAAMLGAEMVGFGTGPLIALGCIMMRKCHLNTCPVGVATQDPELRAKFAGAPEHVVNFFFMIAEEVREILASVGLTRFDQLVGRADMLEQVASELTTRDGSKLDLSALTTFAFNLTDDETRKESHKMYPQDHVLEKALDNYLYKKTKKNIEKGWPAYVESPIINLNRCVGTTVSHELTKIYGGEGLPSGTIHFKLSGSAGQTLGGFLAKGILMELEGDANDYVGKGLSGGTIVVYPSRVSSFLSSENIIVGNVGLYGATSGKAFISGISAERFCVRNSGAMAVIEGVGDHACEYMTGGVVVVLGGTGINFAAGMSGGVAYVYDPKNMFPQRCNQAIVDLEKVSDDHDELELRSLVEEHMKHTNSRIARDILEEWDTTLGSFVKVMPKDLKRVIQEKAAAAKAKEIPAPSKPAEKSKDIEDLAGATKKNGDTVPVAAAAPTVPAAVPIAAKAAREIVVDNPIKKRGFIDYERGAEGYRDVTTRHKDFEEIYVPHDEKKLGTQAARCMDCGIPYCQTTTGCPLGNKIPEWNQLVYEGRWKEGLERLLQTNNFPEFTGRVCPAPCEGSCVLGIIEKPVTIKNIECALIDKGFEQGWIKPNPPAVRTGKKIAIVGSGPAGMAAADQLNKTGHTVTVYERACRPGGLMEYGVPNMKADKDFIVGRRVKLMEDEGVTFICGDKGNISGTPWMLGSDTEGATKAADLIAANDAVILSIGATKPRDLPIPGRELKGVHFAMEFLHKTTKAILDGGSVKEDWKAKWQGDVIDAKDKKVVVIGGGDTGNDCIGTSARMGAASVVNFELLPKPPADRAKDNPWPEWPRIFRVDYGHQEVEQKYGKDPREFLVLSKKFLDDGNGNLKGIETVRVEWTKDESGRFKMTEVPGSEQVFEADLCFLAMGFLGPEEKISEELKVERDPRGNYKADMGKFTTNVEKVFACGDARRGQSLVVWAIAEGRQCAREVDIMLMGETQLP
eukprot:CAMPEP_0184712090 /NCGR_PEP_ID=MMETSP0314-20130426/2675_1 /TAXON_ID=38298 /ORGANISM="Rhodella maculata, Strain CCMP 736" /LENGTH=2103 /DNA_ID=CAMNT_0027174435 /DNA_START=17 /DNA_END=6328 /DNA_ORIENTATION=-